MQVFLPSIAQRADLWEAVATELRRAIVTGALAPGVHLHEPMLAQKFGVSRVPIREALARLEHEGLVRGEPRRGMFVVGMSPATVHEVYDMRILLEVHAARLAAERATVDDLARLQGIVIEMADAAARDEGGELAQLDLRFHRELIDCAGHGRLLAAWEPIAGIVTTLLGVTDTYRGNLPHIIATHQQLVDILRTRDPDAIEVALRRQLTIGEQVMQKTLRALGEARAPSRDRNVVATVP